jgi:hypothetical protein
MLGQVRVCEGCIDTIAEQCSRKECVLLVRLTCTYTCVCRKQQGRSKECVDTGLC